jgi:hypothetical protein
VFEGVRDTRKFLASTGDHSWGDIYEGGWQTCAPTKHNLIHFQTH